MPSPGISVKAVIDTMSRASLERLLGTELVKTIDLLNHGQVSDENLKRVAITLYADNPTVISDDTSRRIIIDSLTLEKARELCAKLSTDCEGNVYSRLKGYEFGRRREEDATLKSFFGIAEDPTAPVLNKPASIVLTPSYALFDHQKAVVQRVLHSLNEHPNKALLHMPTGSGKTRTAMHVIAKHLSERGPTLVCWLANSAELLEQAAEEAERSWSFLGDRPINIYRFWGTKDVDLSSVNDGILIAGFAKLYSIYRKNQNKLISLGDRASLTVVDEAHQAVAQTYKSAIEALYTKRPNNALLGLTATPGRTWDDPDVDKELSRFFNDEKITLKVAGYADAVDYLISEGYLAKPHFRKLEFSGNALDSVQSISSNFDEESSPDFLTSVSENALRNQLIVQAVEELASRHSRILLFASSVDHARLLTGILVARGVEAHVVTGETPIARRERHIRRFKSEANKTIVLANFGVLTTGFDAPKTSAAVIARPTKSLVLYSQMVGRAIRGPRAGGNESAEIVTVIDTDLPGFGDVAEAFLNWDDVYVEKKGGENDS